MASILPESFVAPVMLDFFFFKRHKRPQDQKINGVDLYGKNQIKKSCTLIVKIVLYSVLM